MVWLRRLNPAVVVAIIIAATIAGMGISTARKLSASPLTPKMRSTRFLSETKKATHLRAPNGSFVDSSTVIQQTSSNTWER